MKPISRLPRSLVAIAPRPAILIATTLAAACLPTLSVRPSAAQAPLPAPTQIAPPRIVGRWTGATKSDGTLTLGVYPAPGRQLTYEFSGGTKEHASGTFTLRGANELDFTPTGAAEAEKWTYSFDDQGRVHLTMEEDNPADVEEYILSRAGQ